MGNYNVKEEFSATDFDTIKELTTAKMLTIINLDDSFKHRTYYRLKTAKQY